ncbi:hypothetical protein K7402_01420 [Pseudomonas fluorescens group sp.]|uniref:Uncharacterized protein n=1 Tax=Pseudomonas fluorescens TaxID=294 RepID=A0ACD4XLC3_PSEFL|nr:MULTISPECIES: hypothetical protein [Pseudomonas fluorescens group]KJZ51331.1 hypothetical protein VC37_23625 [Pseudomonas marginalis]KJZ54852.1 hypothetical protein VC36_24320 [Pseudomonas marginalis]MBZ6457188.1 hypothetical protein [Pseudomonas fluorescens group sp.]MBZ6460425.1 hypothetical protein [Pseudomonas fluorescens group sp.]MBZ6466067.1 hypothetical protein [Pseudomonas fluorescens group sp.]
MRLQIRRQQQRGLLLQRGFNSRRRITFQHGAYRADAHLHENLAVDELISTDEVFAELNAIAG